MSGFKPMTSTECAEASDQFEGQGYTEIYTEVVNIKAQWQIAAQLAGIREALERLAPPDTTGLPLTEGRRDRKPR